MILVPILEKYSSLTDKEQKIADYILNNPEQALTETASELAECSSTSAASIVRFAKKIGFDSFSSMKIGLAKYLRNNQYFEKDMIINGSDSYENCASKLMTQISDVCMSTADHLDFASITKIVHMIDKADCIYLMGIGSSANAALELQQKLIRLGKKALYLTDSQINLLSTITVTKNDAVIAFSFSGSTKIVVSSAKSAKKQGAYVIAVTGNTSSPLAAIANEVLLTPAIERKIRIGAVSSRYSQQFICDFLFLCLVSGHYSEAEELTLKASNLLSTIL